MDLNLNGLGILLILVVFIFFFMIPTSKINTVKYNVNGKTYKCPKGFKIDNNLTCVKKYKAILIKD